MQPHASGQDVRGVALLMRQGMAAWMRGIDKPCARTPSREAAQPAAGIAQRLPAIEQMLVNIVAAMALCNIAEEISA